MVADDAVLFREGVARLLAEAGFAVTARVGDAAALLDRVREDPPDVAVVDIRMPPTHTTEGLDAARTLREKHPSVGVGARRMSSRTTRCSSSRAPSGRPSPGERLPDLDELSEAVRRIAAAAW
jgi:DNA-binding NarL/FixJ family response regulator